VVVFGRKARTGGRIAYRIPNALQTVQLVIHDSQHAYSLRDLLLGDGVHLVVLMERPNWAIPGVIVLDVDYLEISGALARGRERVVVMASKATAELAALWRAGVRHVVFHGDTPRTVRVSVLATELSLTAAY
jgi:hypothetical protein